MALYYGHLPTSPAQKVFVAGAAAIRALADPRRADMVAKLSEVTGRVALEKLRARLTATEGGRRILQDRPFISTADMDPARLRFECPPHSFGHAYGEFMHKYSLDADERTPVTLVDDEELAYIMLRYRQVHDFWHVICGLPPTLLGELALKWFELVQTGLPMTALSAVFGPIRLSRKQRMKLATVYIPWAMREGRQAKDLLSVHYESHINTPLDELRTILSVTPAPK